MNFIRCIGGWWYLHVWYYPSRAHPGCLGASWCV